MVYMKRFYKYKLRIIIISSNFCSVIFVTLSRAKRLCKTKGYKLTKIKSIVSFRETIKRCLL